MNLIKSLIKEMLLTETGGISFEVREWSDIIFDEIDVDLTDIEKNVDVKSMYDLQKYVKENDYELVIEGKNYPDVYEKFSVDYWVIRNSSRVEYDHINSGINENDVYVVYLNIPVVTIDQSALTHEIKHAYDDWNRYVNGGAPIRDSKEIRDIYTSDFQEIILKIKGKDLSYLYPVVLYYYYSSKLETPSYLENVYDNKIIDYENLSKKLKNFKIDNFLDEKGDVKKSVVKEFESLKKYDIPLFRKFNNVKNFLLYTQKYFNKRGRDIFKKIIKMKYIHGKYKKPLENKKEYSNFVKNTVDGWSYSDEMGWYYDQDRNHYYDNI
jgi:hypothetical protein